MKLICLNIWGGSKTKENELKAFLEKNSKDTDIFCFQEVFDITDDKKDKEAIGNLVNIPNINKDLINYLKLLLPNFNSFFCPVYSDVYGIAIFVKKDISVKGQGDSLIYKCRVFPDPEDELADHNRKIQWVDILKDNKTFRIFNLHGHWTHKDRGGKGDTEKKIKQTQKIVEQVKSSIYPCILAGDFNSRPDTESIRMIDKILINQITKNGILSTRPKEFNYTENYADYIFTSPDIKVDKFEVMSDVVSDHSPLSIKFN